MQAAPAYPSPAYTSLAHTSRLEVAPAQTPSPAAHEAATVVTLNDEGVMTVEGVKAERDEENTLKICEQLQCGAIKVSHAHTHIHIPALPLPHSQLTAPRHSSAPVDCTAC